jgi:hypothetical protein
MKILELIAPSSPTGFFIAFIILGVPAVILIVIALFLAFRIRFRTFGVH